METEIARTNELKSILEKVDEAVQFRIKEIKSERDEAREALEEETKFHHRTRSELIKTQCELMDIKTERDKTTTAQQYKERILEGIKILTDPLTDKIIELEKNALEGTISGGSIEENYLMVHTPISPTGYKVGQKN